MQGNAFEWVLDLYAPYPATTGSVPVDPTGPAAAPGGNRVDRGGGWNSTAEMQSRAWFRGSNTATGRSILGFRCAHPRL